jgi:hypothetical protein
MTGRGRVLIGKQCRCECVEEFAMLYQKPGGWGTFARGREAGANSGLIFVVFRFGSYNILYNRHLISGGVL